MFSFQMLGEVDSWVNGSRQMFLARAPYIHPLSFNEFEITRIPPSLKSERWLLLACHDCSCSCYQPVTYGVVWGLVKGLLRRCVPVCSSRLPKQMVSLQSVPRRINVAPNGKGTIFCYQNFSSNFTLLWTKIHVIFFVTIFWTQRAKCVVLTHAK